MRNATREEIKCVEKYINDIAYPTGINFYEELEIDGNHFKFNAFIIQAKDTNEGYKDCRYHAGDGVMVEDVKDALFHTSKKQAEMELSYFDEPDEFEIKEFSVCLRMK